MAVSNQMPKGKRVLVSSTKANSTTKENIANVYGAKTLFALLPLDLRLEMAPSTGMGRCVIQELFCADAGFDRSMHAERP